MRVRGIRRCRTGANAMSLFKVAAGPSRQRTNGTALTTVTRGHRTPSWRPKLHKQVANCEQCTRGIPTCHQRAGRIIIMLAGAHTKPAHKTCTQEQVLLTSAALGRASTQRACVYADGVSTQTTLRGNPTRHRQAMVSEVATTWLQHTVRHFSSTTDAQLHSYTTQTQCAQGTPQ